VHCSGASPPCAALPLLGSSQRAYNLRWFGLFFPSDRRSSVNLNKLRTEGVLRFNRNCDPLLKVQLSFFRGESLDFPFSGRFGCVGHLTCYAPKPTSIEKEEEAEEEEQEEEEEEESIFFFVFLSFFLVRLVNDSEYSKSAGAKPILYPGCIYLVFPGALRAPTPPAPFFGGGKYQ
jgi:hypothetical protein